MIIDTLSALRTDPGLLERVRNAPRPSARELFEQKVSFVFASIGQSTTLTKEKVRELILEQAGGSTTAK